jgi:hypothetical protein
LRGADTETRTEAITAVRSMLGPRIIIVMDSGDPPPFNLGPCLQNDSSNHDAGRDQVDAAKQVLHLRAQLRLAFQEPHVLCTPLRSSPVIDVVQTTGALVVVGLSR